MSLMLLVCSLRYPVTATSFHLIGKETERSWEQGDDISTLMPSLVRFGSDTGVADEQLRKRPIANTTGPFWNSKLD